MFYRGQNQIVYFAIDGVYLPVGCLTNNNFEETSDFLDTTTRDNEGWKTSIPANQGYTFSFDGLQINTVWSGGDFSKLSYDKLKQLKRSRTLLNFRIKTTDEVFIEIGKAYIQNIGEAAPVDDFLTFNVSMVGYGKPVSETKENVTWDSTAVTMDNTLIAF